MSALVALLLVDLVVSAVTCAIVYRHHKLEFSGPDAATSRIMMALTDMRVRLDMVERMLPNKEV